MLKRTLYSELSGKKPVGKLRRSWTDAVNEDCKEILNIWNWKTEAMNRQGWRGLIEEAMARLWSVMPQEVEEEED
jgi:hypothetical protein